MNEVLHLLDPVNRARKLSQLINRNAIREHRTMDSLMDVLQSASSPLLAVADVVGTTVDHWTYLTERSANSLYLLLVIVPDEESGYRWLRAGATDFAVVERGKELNARFKRILKLHGDLLSPEFQGRMQGEFLRHIAHEMMTPLNCIFGFTEILLLDPGVSEQARGDLRRILNNAEVLLDICKRLSHRFAESAMLQAH